MGAPEAAALVTRAAPGVASVAAKRHYLVVR
jgi:hypothetical protein